MTYDDPPDDEDWYDDDDAEPEDAPPRPCPECGKPIADFLDKCPACGYWLSAADRRALKPHESTPAWVKVTALVLLAVTLLGLATFLF
jgi:hypothetical protein